MFELDALLAPLPGDDGCGPDIRYDPKYAALDDAAKGKPEQEFGKTRVAAVEPNWSDVESRAQELLAKSKDLHVAATLARAWTHIGNAEGLAAGLTLIKELLVRNWDAVYPRLDPEGGDLQRLNAIAALADPNTFLRDVRAVFVFPPGPKGRLQVRDLLISAGKLAAGKDAALTPEQVTGMLRAAQPESSVSVQALRRACVVAGELQSWLTDKVAAVNAERANAEPRPEPSQAPSLQPLIDVLTTAAALGESALGIGSEAAPAQGGGDTVPSDGGSGRLSQLRSRDDAVRLLGTICEFIERTEPSNPAPLLLRRAGRLMNKNFVEIIQDLAPDSIGQIRTIVGGEEK